MTRLASLLILVMLTACKTVPVAGACPDSQGLRCLTVPECVYDRDRGCMQCRCSEASPRLDRQSDNGTRPIAPATDPLRP